MLEKLLELLKISICSVSSSLFSTNLVNCSIVTAIVELFFRRLSPSNPSILSFSLESVAFTVKTKFSPEGFSESFFALLSNLEAATSSK